MSRKKKKGVMRRIFISFYFFIIVMMFIVIYAVSPALDYFLERYFDKPITSHVQEIFKGVYHVTINDFLQIDEEKWSECVAEMQKGFGYPISLVSLDDVKLSEKNKEKLIKGELVITSKWELLYQRIGTSDQVLMMEPALEFKLDNVELAILVWLPIVLTILPLTFIWAIPFWLRLVKIIKAANQFGDGQLDVRAAISPHAALYPLAETFNDMADHIQQLINSHKQLTSAVSHELRTPISRIHFSLEMLETTRGDSDKYQHYTGEIHKDITELETLVSELLSYSRLDRERPDFEFADHTPFYLIENLVKETGNDSSSIEITLHSSIIGSEKSVTCDKRMIERALSNLLRNAAQHAETVVHISIEDNKEDISIHFDDDGPGIPEADRVRIFEPFVRLDSSRSRNTGGYGLGLAIVYQIVSWHKGKVFATQSDLGGARFTLQLPKKGLSKLK